MGIVFLPPPPTMAKSTVCVCVWWVGWVVGGGGLLSFLLSCPLFNSHPAQTLPGLHRGGTGEKRHMPSRPLHTHTKRGEGEGGKKIKLLRHARMRTRAYERMLARSLARSSYTKRDNNGNV